MKELCYVVQGVTFLKSMMPMIIFSNTVNIKPVIFFIKTRGGKNYDSLWSKKEHIESLLKDHNVLCDYRWFDNQSQVLTFMKENNHKHLVCQDAHGHGKIFCEDKEVKVYSIGVFFDTLHHANDLKTGRLKYKSYPDRVYIPNEKFKSTFLNLCTQYNNIPVKSLGSPLYDHCLFLDTKKTREKLVTFLVTQQSLVSKETQIELEEFINYCYDKNISVVVKTKSRTPWVFLNSSICNKVTMIDTEEGFPSTSMSLILKSSVIISSYSTAAVEAKYFGVPCINLESVDKDKLTYAVRSIKYEYDFEDYFNSDTCITAKGDIVNAFEKLCYLKTLKNNIITHSDNSSLKILKDIRGLL